MVRAGQPGGLGPELARGLTGSNLGDAHGTRPQGGNVQSMLDVSRDLSLDVSQLSWASCVAQLRARVRRRG